MPGNELNENVKLTQSPDLISNKESAASSLLSDAYQWGNDHKIEIGLAVGLLATGALVGGKLISNSRRAMAEMYGPSAAELSLARPKFVVHDDSILGGRIGSTGPSEQALAAKLHEIP